MGEYLGHIKRNHKAEIDTEKLRKKNAGSCMTNTKITGQHSQVQRLPDLISIGRDYKQEMHMFNSRGIYIFATL